MRSGRKRATYTSKELAKDMQVFLETGVHPHLERVQQEVAGGGHGVLTPLPDPDPTRPHVFMDITVDNKPAGGLLSLLSGCVVCAHVRRVWPCVTPPAGAVVSRYRVAAVPAARAYFHTTSNVTVSYSLLSCSIRVHTGRLVIELFEDVAPAAARHLLTRCSQGSAASVQGTMFHKLLPGYALFGGKR